MRNFLKKIHLWLAIPAGLFIVILCTTGAIMSFQDEILEIYYPERYFIESTDKEKLSLAELIPIVNKQLDDNSVSNIKISTDPSRTYIATLDKGFRITAFIDPYTGDIKGINVFRDGFFFKIMTLHRWLMDGSRTWGKYTMGIATLMFVMIIVSGVVWWVPTKRKHLKNRLVVKTKYGAKRFFYDCHIALGIYASIFLLVCALTGLMWSFDWYRSSVYKILGTEVAEKKKDKEDKAKKEELNIKHWDEALSNIQNIEERGYKFITIGDGEVSVLSTSAPHLRATDKYQFDNKTGTILKRTLYKDQDNIMTWAYALHVGAYGGIITRILTCLACIIGATLPLTGYYIWWRKRYRKHKK